MPNTIKIQKVKDISQKVQKASSLTFFEYTKLGANALNDLRNKAKEVEAEVLVAKNTLVKIALADKKPQEGDLQGQTGLLLAFADSLSPLKVLYDFSKKFESLKIKGAFVDGSYYESTKVLELGQLPTKNDLLVGVLRGFNNPVAKFVYVLSAVADKKGVQE